jgi:DNA-binding NarL/FixJ family response regulator
VGADGAGSNPIRTLLVDDNPAVLRQIVEVLPNDIEIVDMLEDGAGLATSIAEHRPDVVVLDITLPGENGLALASALRRQGCESRIVFLTVHEDADYVRFAMAAGAFGYVVKMRLSLDLETAIRAAAERRPFISPMRDLEL